MTAKELKDGMMAPTFTAEATGGGTNSLGDFKGKTVVLYFYPKDSTPGCTREACAFRDAQAQMKKLGAVVLGVSRDASRVTRVSPRSRNSNSRCSPTPSGR